jgi:phosphoribosylanthranilate isomerase
LGFYQFSRQFAAFTKLFLLFGLSMPLKTLVKVGNITNLSDARYCAGMGVDFLGFTVVEGQPQYVPVKTYQEIRGWVAGPKVVIEMYGYTNNVSFDEIIANYAPDMIECGVSEYPMLQPKTNLPFLLKLNKSDIPHLTTPPEFFIVNETDLATTRKQGIPLLVVLNAKGSLDKVLSTDNVRGVVLSGSSEIRPGFKEYDDLAEVLEALEVD